jgi:hypothetical protein
MRNFKLDDVYSIVCESKDTRNGFKHVATLLKNGVSIYDTKIRYLNRTWERFQYESVLLKVVDDFIAQCDRTKYRDVISKFN